MLATIACAVGIQAPTMEWQPPIPVATLASAKTALIPFPRGVEWRTGDLELGGDIRIAVEAGRRDELAQAVSTVRSAFARFDIRATPGAASAPATRSEVRITLDEAANIRPQGYRLEVASSGIRITGSDPAGVYYGTRTLEQMIRREGRRVLVQCATIDDWPAFSWRGFMHDTGRNYQRVAELKRQIDLASAFKVNLFHWHLTDNPAWRPESRAYPILNDPKYRKPGRDPNRSYTFDEIREVIDYAKRRYVRVMPELDMPGHSAYFRAAFGFPMDDPRGIAVLETLISEFCREVPKSDAPWLHIGSDEVRISDPVGFMKRVGDRVRSLGRIPVIWNPGLPNDGTMIEQSWSDEGGSRPANTISAGRLDSSMGYANLYDPLQLVQRYFFGQPCRVPLGDAKSLGPILCIWPDVRVIDKRNIERHNGVWPGMLAMAEAAWVGRPSRSGDLMTLMPESKSTAGAAFAEFEKRMAGIRDRFLQSVPFPYASCAKIPWRITGPAKTGAPRVAYGGSVQLADPDGGQGIFRNQKELGVAYAETRFYSRSSREVRAWVGFETPARSNRRGGGTPARGAWDPFGGEVEVNGRAVRPPDWKNPGANRHLSPTWEQRPNEVPFADEEFFWTREPARLNARKGWNDVRIKVPCGYMGQNWGFAFVPVKKGAAGRWVEDEDLEFVLQ